MAKPDVVKLPSANVLKTLISKGKSADAEIAETRGGYGATIADAVDKHNLHAGAFKLVRKWQRMDAVKLMALLTHLDDYRAKLELDKLVAADLPEQEEDEDEGAAEGGRPKPMFDEGKSVN